MKRRTSRTLGLLMMTSSLAIGALGPMAASATTTPEEAAEAGENVRSAFWNGSSSEWVPNAATKQFPPEAVCLVQPQACNFPTDDPLGLGTGGNELIDQMNAAFGEGRDGVQSNDPGAPADPVSPGDLPVSIAFGQAHYRAAVEFPLPSIPAGEQVDDFIIFLSQSNPTFSNASPALRQAVLAMLTCARTTETGAVGGRCEQEEFEKVALRSCSGEVGATPDPCMREDSPLQVEACPIANDPSTPDVDESVWDSGDSQSEDTVPWANCLFGSSGTMIETDGGVVWAFDLTFAARGWLDGSLPYEGMLLRPGSGENFAFGDAETTYSKQTTFNGTVSYAMASSAPPPPPAPFEPPPAPPTATGGGDTFTPAPPPTTTTPTTSSDPFVSPPIPAANSPMSVPEPAAQVAEPAAVDQPQVSTDTGTTENALPVAIPTDSAWWWLPLILLMLGGAWLLSRSLGEEVAIAASRSGAMTRLLERRSLERTPDLIGR